MKINKHPWFHVILISGFFLLSIHFLMADLPVQNFFFAQWKPLREAALVFPPEEVKAFEKAFKKTVIKRSKEHASISAEYFDKTFTPVEENLFTGLVDLIKAAVSRGETEKVNRFMKAVTDKRSIQGLEISRLGGPFYVILTLALDDNNEYIFQYQNRQIDEGEYQGATFMYHLGLYASSDRENAVFSERTP